MQIANILKKLLISLLLNNYLWTINSNNSFLWYFQQINSETAALDDTIDIDNLFDDDADSSSFSSASKTPTTRDLDVQDLLDDELQPVQQEAEDNSSWLMRGVHRVRRWLGAAEKQQQKAVKAKSINNKPHKKRNAEELKKHKAEREQLRLQRQAQKEQKKLSKAKLNKHNKRAYGEDEYGPGEGSGYGEPTELEKSYCKYFFFFFLNHMKLF